MKNKKAGRRSAPHMGENGGLFCYIGAYVAFALFVYHSLVVLVIAFTGPFGYACVTKNEEVHAETRRVIRVDGDDVLGSEIIDTIGPFQADQTVAVALAEEHRNAISP